MQLAAVAPEHAPSGQELLTPPGGSPPRLIVLASGAAVVAAAAGGLPEVVGDAGVVVPRGDPGALAEALISLGGNPSACSPLGEAARERVLDRFTLDRMFGACVQATAGLVGRRGFRTSIG